MLADAQKERVRKSLDDVDEDEPKLFLDRKQKYARDAQMLYATYQDEWSRLERLGQQRLGSRRRSLLTVSERPSGSSGDEAGGGGGVASANSSRQASPARSIGAESPQPARKGAAAGGRRTPPSRRASPAPLQSSNPAAAAAADTNRALRSPSRGTVQAAKEALERRSSRVSNEASSPTPTKRFRL